MGVGVGVRAGVDVRTEASLRVRTSPKSGSGELKVVELGLSKGLLSWSIVQLSFAMALLGAEILSSLLGTIKLYKRFFWQMAIFELSRRVEKML